METSNRMTHYEYTRIRGIRLQQLEDGFTPFVDFDVAARQSPLGCRLKAKEFFHTFGDLHLYSNHVEQAKEQLSRAPRALPQMKINPSVKDINDFKFEDFELLNYDPYPAIKAPIAV